MGGLFFRARDPDALNSWYAAAIPDEWSLAAQGGPMAFAPFKADMDCIAAAEGFMINFRVSDLDVLLDGLRAADIAIITKAEWNHPDVGRFARIHDPEGNVVELWGTPTHNAP